MYTGDYSCSKHLINLVCCTVVYYFLFQLSLYFFHFRGNVVAFGLCAFAKVCDYAKSSRTIFMKPCRNRDYRCDKNPFHFGVGPAKSGEMAVILDF